MSRLVIGISFPKTLIEKIDRERGLVSRSKWVVHALELAAKVELDHLAEDKKN